MGLRPKCHVGVQRLGARDARVTAPSATKAAGLVRIDEATAWSGDSATSTLGLPHDLAHAEHDQDGEPEQHDRPEQTADAAGAEVLHGEQADQHDHGDRQDERLEGGRGDLQALDRAQHRDGGCEQAVAVEQRRAQHAQITIRRCAGAPSAAARAIPAP